MEVLYIGGLYIFKPEECASVGPFNFMAFIMLRPGKAENLLLLSFWVLPSLQHFSIYVRLQVSMLWEHVPGQFCYVFFF